MQCLTCRLMRYLHINRQFPPLQQFPSNSHLSYFDSTALHSWSSEENVNCYTRRAKILGPWLQFIISFLGQFMMLLFRFWRSYRKPCTLLIWSEKIDMSNENIWSSCTIISIVHHSSTNLHHIRPSLGYWDMAILKFPPRIRFKAPWRWLARVWDLGRY